MFAHILPGVCPTVNRPDGRVAQRAWSMMLGTSNEPPRGAYHAVETGLEGVVMRVGAGLGAAWGNLLATCFQS
jgi:hypothetical protein